MSHRDADTLRELYHERGMSQSEMADKLGVGQTTVSKWMRRHDIKRSRANYNKNGHHTITKKGYSKFQVSIDGKNHNVQIHRLAAVAWFGLDAVKGMDVHHKSGFGFDNREENLELLTKEEHTRRHHELARRRG